MFGGDAELHAKISDAYRELQVEYGKNVEEKKLLEAEEKILAEVRRRISAARLEQEELIKRQGRGATKEHIFVQGDAKVKARLEQ